MRIVARGLRPGMPGTGNLLLELLTRRQLEQVVRLRGKVTIRDLGRQWLIHMLQLGNLRHSSSLLNLNRLE